MVKKIGLSLISLGLIFATLEIGAGFFHPQATPTKFDQAYIPPFPAKDPDGLRIFVYGGSTVQGLPEPKVGLVAQLDDQLHSVLGPTRDIEVYNLGWSGYNSTMVRYLVNRTINEQPDLLIIDTGHNEFIYPQLDFYPLLKLSTTLGHRSNLFKLASSLFSRHNRSPSAEEPLEFRRPPHRLTWPYYPIKIWIFQRNLQAIVKLARYHHIPLILATPVSNVADWPPVYQQVTTLSRPIPDNRNARLLYQQAQAASASGQISLAQELFIKAKDWDLIPWRTSTAQNDFIRSFEDRSSVWVADTDKELSARSPNQLIGFDFIIDNVHPTKEGNYLIAQTILQLIKQQKIVKPDWWENTRPQVSLNDFLNRIKFSSQDEYRIYLSTARYSLKNPFFHFSIAANYLKLAQKLNPRHWQPKALLASIAFLTHRPDQARQLLYQAEQLYVGHLQPKIVARYIPYLNRFYAPPDL